MKYKIIGDSCMDVTLEDRKDPTLELVPLTLTVGGYDIIDDASFDQKDFLRRVAACPECPKSACPSPEAYLNAIKRGNADMVFIITLSHHLSGSYNSAMVAKSMYEEESGTSKVLVLSSESASAGESVLGFRIREMAEAGMEFEEICEKITKIRDELIVMFVLESLDTLRKNGRLTGLQAIVANVLNIKPVMIGEHGVIQKAGQARGINKALARMVEQALQLVKGGTEDKILAITSCNCPQRAEMVKEMFLSKASFQRVYLADTAGVSSLYAGDGGVIVNIL